MAAFKEVIRTASAGTLVVLDLANCNPATRAWCVYEWSHTLSSYGPDGLHMLVTPTDRAVLVHSLDVGDAECFKPQDKHAILADVVVQHGSAEAFNNQLRLQLLLEPLSYRVDVRRLIEAAQGTRWRLGVVQRWLDGDVVTGVHGDGSVIGLCGAGPTSDGEIAGRAGIGGGGGGSSRMLCISGGAGEGKSTIAAVLCSGAAETTMTQQDQQRASVGRVAAHHFLKYSDQRRLDPVRIVKSLAFQIATRCGR